MHNIWSKIKSNIKILYQKGALHVIGGNFATKFVTFFGSIVVVRLLSKSDYGVLGYIENLFSIAYLFAGFGMANSILRYVVLGKDLDEKYSLFRYMRRHALMCNLLLMGIFAGVAILYPHPHQFISARYLLIIMMLQLPFHYMFDNDLMAERAMFRNRAFAYASFGSMVIVVIGRCIGAYISGVLGVIIGINVVYLAMSIVLNRKVENDFSGAVATDIGEPKKKEINSYGAQYMITNGLWALFMLVDVFMMGKLSGSATAVADYKVAYVWPGNIGIIVSAIAIFVTPYFVRHEDDHAWVRKYYLKLLLVNTVIVGIMGALIFIFAKPLILLYAGKPYLNTVGLLRTIVLATFINNAFRATTANILAAMGQIRFNMIVSIVGMISQIVLDFILIPKYGGYGVAATGIINFSLMSIALFVFFAKKYELFSSKKIGKL